MCLRFLSILKTIENENSVFEFMETVNSSPSTSDLKNYRAPTHKIGKNRRDFDSSMIGINNLNQNRAKKLGAIMGIAKRSRSIHYTEWCPSKHFSSLFLLVF